MSLGWLELLTVSLVLPAVTLDTLLCHFCPLQYKGKTCTNLTTQCPPDHLCSSSRGYFGSVHIVSSQGCLSRTLCGSYQILSHRGIEYNASHTCCCGHKCNSKPKSDSSLKKAYHLLLALTLVTVVASFL
uniref:UPAR/Ly6 domain-containing protein n=1 Tax=Cynoglossus semilaevis TaxID=244447 RepID=A0A3P8WTE0_CYNSE